MTIDKIIKDHFSLLVDGKIDDFKMICDNTGSFDASIDMFELGFAVAEAILDYKGEKAIRGWALTKVY